LKERNSPAGWTIFLLVGDGAERERLEREARRDGLNNVIFTGRQDKNLIPDLLAASDVCLVHLRKAGLFKTVLPSKMFEAAAMQKPILLGLEGYSAELLTSAGAGLCVEPENERALVDSICRLRSDPDMRRNMGIAARRMVETEFDISTLARDYLRILEPLTSGK